LQPAKIKTGKIKKSFLSTLPVPVKFSLPGFAAAKLSEV
jgi:hypothetical protein